MNLFAKFRQWHNGGLVEKKQLIQVCEAVKALGIENMNKLLVPTAKPHIYPTYYPKLRRVYWRVSEMPSPWRFEDRPLWDAAHKHACYLNDVIGAKIEAERLAKKEKRK